MQPVFKAADILLPRPDADMTLWPALACDQFTSQPAYWEKAQALCKDKHSALHITLPEVYLEQPDVAARIDAIHAAMTAYQTDVLTRTLHGFVYVERCFAGKPQPRCGLVGAVDLDAYSYEAGAKPLVRPSENTVVERIPPRLAVRRGAPLETPHILMLVDDAACRVIEPFTARAHAGDAAALQQVYDADLMLGGGHITGWAVTDDADLATVEQAVAAFGTQGSFDAQYPQAAGSAPIVMAVGDGNHSLATAKAYWEEVKAGLSVAQRATHPARFCLVELVNVHSPAIEIEPIHRAVFGVSGTALAEAFTAWLTENAAVCTANGDEGSRAAPRENVLLSAATLDVRSADADSVQTFTFVGAAPDGADLRIEAADTPHPLAVGTLEAFLAKYCADNPALRVDYIHGEDAVRELTAQGAAGVLLPDFAKRDLFRGVVLGGVLPKKTFSMGEATEKRYYLECRAIE